MKLDLRDILIEMKKRKTLDLYAAHFGYNKDEPFNKPLKRLQPIKVRLEFISSHSEIKLTDIEIKNLNKLHLHREFDSNIVARKFNKKGTLTTDRLEFFANRYRLLQNNVFDLGFIQFFESFDKAVDYWNFRVEEHKKLMKDNIVELENKMKEFVEKNLIK